MIHVGTTPVCLKRQEKNSRVHTLGLGVREISVAAGTGADVLACGAGTAGPTPDVRHQPLSHWHYPLQNPIENVA